MRSLRVEFRDDFDAGALNQLLDELEADGRSRLMAAGIAGGAITIERLADMRLVGQMHDIAVALPGGPVTAASLPAIRDAFVAAYSTRYTAVFPGARIEAVTLRVRAVGPVPKLSRGTDGGRTVHSVQQINNAATELLEVSHTHCSSVRARARVFYYPPEVYECVGDGA